MSVKITLDRGTTFTQWDKDRYIFIEGYTDTSDVKVHYTTDKNGVAFVVLPVWDTSNSKWKAGVPSTILTTGDPVKIYIYDETLEATGTVYKYTVLVEQRAQPADYIYASYDSNVLRWPYEENIEEILRREQERILAENARESNENLRIEAEATRDSNEAERIKEERIRIQNEEERKKIAQNLQLNLSKITDLNTEIVEARGTYDTLAKRLNAYPDKSIVDITLESDGSIILTFSDGTTEDIGQVSTGGGTGGLGGQIIDIKKTASSGNVDTYTIYIDTGDKYTFTVTNGTQGPRGESGVYVGTTAPTDPDINVWIDPEGATSTIHGATFIPSVSSEGIISWTNDRGMMNPTPVSIKGPKGDIGSPGGTYIPSISSDGKLSWTNDAGLDNPDPVNVVGPEGTLFTPSVDTEGNISWSNTGGKPNPTTVNIRGPRGYVFTPSVSDEGVISWTNEGSLENPNSQNIKGPRGESGVYVGATAPTDPSVNVWIDPEGATSTIHGATFIPSVSSEGIISWTNDRGMMNPTPVSIKGPTGDTGATFTPSVSNEGVLSWSNDKSLENPANVDLKGPRGDTGYVFTPSVSTDGIISWINNGNLTNPTSVNIRGPQGTQGPRGYVFTPTVSEDGVISWANDGGLENPASRSIRGPKGDTGDTIIFTPSVDTEGNLSWSNNGGLANPETVNIRGPQGEASSGGDAALLEGHPASYFATADHDHDDATQTKHGFLSISDKAKLDTLVGSNKSAQGVGVGDSPTFGTVTADKVIGAVYA